jgi:CRISPR-associated exonuclease Cas4
MYDEDDLLPLSGLQHLAFCPRQWGLIHVECSWIENRLTAEGRIGHNRVHLEATETRGNVRRCGGLALRSLRLGVAGKADLVEFHRVPVSGDAPVAGSVGTTVRLPGAAGEWTVFPVEFKRGRPKGGDCDRVQLCAQAICLEEMLGVGVRVGALFYGEPHRRTDVEFDAPLRARTSELAITMHELARAGKTPPPSPGSHCASCSLKNVCSADWLAAGRSVKDYLSRVCDSGPME